MQPMRHLDRDTRRARLLAARTRPVGGINRRGIFTGHWDGGDPGRKPDLLQYVLAQPMCRCHVA